MKFSHLLGPIFLALASVGTAHSELVTSSPKHASTVREPLAEVSLTFSERIEPQFSTFTVVPLTASGDAEGLERQAEALLEHGPDLPNAVEAELTTAEVSETVVLSLPEGLEPGAYAVLWRALSADTHTLQDFLVFTYEP